MMPDHVHMLISIPPKYSVAQIIGFIKEKAPYTLHAIIWATKKFYGQQFWARGYHVTTVDRDESMVREYIRAQEQETVD